MTQTLDEPARTADRRPAVKPHFRADIQGLRAVAIALVFLYHLAPNYLTGGFVGVDVFFVISGYLISSHLLREAESTGRVRLLGFYARRARRLLPASLTVLLLVAALTLVAVPRTLWVQVFSNVIAAATYVENWALASSAVDYLAAGTETNPVQHYWSLSTEEQFYLVWPLMILVIAAVLARRRLARAHLRRTVAIVFAVVGLGSFAASIVWTGADQASAYFATPVRAWEFAAGGLVAVLPAMPRGRFERVRALVAALGALAVLISAAVYTGGTAFPGVAALLPVAGAALLIAADAPRGPISITGPLSWRPVQWLGNVSYSVYLVHWPLLVLPSMIWPNLPYASRLLAIPAALVAAALLNRFVERPFLSSDRLAARLGLRRPRPVLLLTAGAMAVVVAVAVPGLVITSGEMAADRVQLARATADLPRCLGAEADSAGCGGVQAGRALLPSPLIASDDVDDRQCLQHQTRTAVLTCSFGPADGTPVALMGDSHAHVWIPALAAIARQRHWRITTYLRANCPLLDEPVTGFGSAAQCAAWGRAALREAVAARYAMVFVSAHNEWQTPSAASLAQTRAFAAAWRALQSSGARLIAIEDTPQPTWTAVSDPVSCVFDERVPADCSFSLSKATSSADPLLAARREVGDVALIDLNGVICPGGTCDAVQGGVVVYRDPGHLTSTYVRTLTAALDARLPSFATR